MDFVNIGSAGNAADNTGYGSVGYDYRIATYEVSAAQWIAEDTAAGIGDAGLFTGSRAAVSISWNDAAMFCNWLTSGSGTAGAYAVNGSGVVTGIDRTAAVTAYGMVYVIPTEDEWYKAAYYSPIGVYYDYPTGSNTAPISVAGGTAAGTAVYAQAASANVNSSGGLSPFLTMGQGGNVWELNETLIGGGRGMRGASNYEVSGGMRADFRPAAVTQANESASIGFRVAALGVVPEPGSFGLLVLGLAGMVARRRRAGR